MEMKRAILSVLVLLALGGTVHADDELPFPEGWRQVNNADLEASRKLEGYVQPTGQRLATCGDITGDGQVDCVRYLINIADEETSIIMSVGGTPLRHFLLEQFGAVQRYINIFPANNTVGPADAMVAACPLGDEGLGDAECEPADMPLSGFKGPGVSYDVYTGGPRLRVFWNASENKPYVGWKIPEQRL